MPVVVLYSAGYRLGTDLSLEPTGGIYLYYPDSGLYVSINDLPPERTAIFTKSIYIPELVAGKYDVVAIKDGYTNWKKEISVSERRVSEAYPFLILNPVATTTIPTQNRAVVKDLFSATTTRKATVSLDKTLEKLATTTSSSTIASNEGVLWRNTYLYKDNKKLMALWKGEANIIPFYFCGEETKLCDSSILVTDSKSPIKNFDFYPGRNDVVVYSNADGVFVTELDKRGGVQNFVTLATGKVDFRISGRHIYIKDHPKDQDIFYEVIFE